jgi:hypothetical protein
MTHSKQQTSHTLTHIRFNHVLRIEDGFDDEIKFFMPQAQVGGSISTIESIMPIKLMRVVNPGYIFEFGTYKGLTTRLLLSNLPTRADIKSERIYTLDLPSIEGIQFQGSDIDVAKEAIGFYRKYLDLLDKKHLVKQLLQDSLTLDTSQYLKKFQYIFIDGNHQIKYARSDTEKTFEMLAEAPSCIIWHDYGNPEFPELTNYIEELASSYRIYHLEETMLAFHVRGINVTSRN